MSKTLFKLRLFGIAAFLLFFVSSVIDFQVSSGSFQLNQVQQISILVSFVIFAFLMLVHLYQAFTKAIKQETED